MNERIFADRTVAAYRLQARRAIANWSRGRQASPFLKRFVSTLPAHARVLDYGCGIGREIRWMKGRGFRPEGVDATLEFVLEARRRCPGVSIRHARFERVALEPHAYDGIWCNAGLIHVPPGELKYQLDKLRKALRPGGVLGLTLAWGRHRGFTKRDWIPGRYLAAYRRDEVTRFLQGWELLRVKVSSGEKRKGRWIQVLARRKLS